MKKRMKPNEFNVFLYHDNCHDGKAAETIARAFANTNSMTNVIFMGVKIGSRPSFGLLHGKNVLICDFSYKREDIEAILKIAKNLLIIDHHVTTIHELSEIDEIHKILDIEHSGAMLAWKYFFSNIEAPLLIKYIEDRDLWTRKMQYIDEFNAWFTTVPFDFDEYKKYMIIDNESLMEKIKTEGSACLKLINIQIADCIRGMYVSFTQIAGEYYFVGYINSAILRSDIGYRVLQDNALIDFAAIFSIGCSNTVVSLRSRNCGSNVNRIATHFNGGGHKASSALKLNGITNYLPSQVFDPKLFNIFSNEKNISTESWGDLNILYLNSKFQKKELAKYLLQDRDESVQVGANLIKEKLKINIERVHVACVWSFNGYDTVHNVCIDNSVNIKKEIIEMLKLSSFRNSYNVYTVKYPGFSEKLNFV